MSFSQIYQKYKDFKFENKISLGDIQQAIGAAIRDERQLFALLCPEAENYLEEIAVKAHSLTLANFGKTIQLYTPLYLSNYCDNQCSYCGFNSRNNLTRKRLTEEELEKEAGFISSTGLRHILVLTGESRDKSSPEYIKDCVRILKKYFSSISLEIYPLSQDEYADMIQEGVDGLTLYQETYDENIYAQVHKSGPKKDYLFRLDAPERAARAGMRSINIGVLLGLNDWRREVFFMSLHAKYLQDKFSDLEIGVSVPRLRPHLGDSPVTSPVSDKNLAQIITALRIFSPRLGISLSTRESPLLRENLLALGITRMSAGSSTKVGGHTIEYPAELNPPQFEISDRRSVEEVKHMLIQRGYQPVLKDWLQL